MRPERPNIAAPELSQRVRWVGGNGPARIGALLANGPVLVHFFDFAQLNSRRALPYQLAWHERYAEHGLTVLGAHTPRFPFTADRQKLAAAVERLGIRYPVVDDSGYELWQDYGCRGWPSLFLWGPEGTLRWFHFGEGEYGGTEAAIAEELRRRDPAVELPRPLEPLRPEDAPGTLVAPPSEELFPGGSPSEPWRGAAPGEALEIEYAAGGAYASVDGTGELLVSVDRAAPASIEIHAPGLYELASHQRHSEHRLRVEAKGDVAVYSVSFAPALR